MKLERYIIITLFAVLAVLILSACGGTQVDVPTDVPADADVEEHSDDEEHAAQPVEEHDDGDEHGAIDMVDEHEHVEGPEEYTSLSNPFAGDAAAVEAGKNIFEANCMVCHGSGGKGDGPTAETLNPKPANLADAAMMNSMTDGYLFWRTSEGGLMEPFNSQMPPWMDILSEEEIWQVLSYVRTLSSE